MTATELAQAVETAGRDLEPGDIVLVRTGRDAFYAEPDYMFRGPGVTAEATAWLFERGVRVMGIDAWGWDAPSTGRRPTRARAASPGSSGRRTSVTSRTCRSSGW